MKTLFKITGMFIVLLTLGCGGNDDDGGTTPMMEDASIVGDWQRNSGTILGLELDYLLVNEDNTINILNEDALGFRDNTSGNYTATDEQVTVDFSFFGTNLVNYSVTETTLELRESNGNLSTYTRVSDAPNVDSWITRITVLSQGDAPWDEDADIAFNGSHILLGNGYEAESIGLVNTETFALDGTITTTESAFAVEVEKFDVPDKYIFQSNNGFSGFTAFTEDTNTEIFTSLEMGAWIKGLASINSTHIWASSGNEDTLYLLSYNSSGTTQVIEQTIELDRDVQGLDYQSGFLYVCSNGNIYKCDASDSFQVVETITLEGYSVNGIAFDGTNFWVNARSRTGGPRQIIQTSLTL
ncbi:hypothetical protein EAX61_13085 [Dokdonia sinensis]|uniref:Lipocalin-like domain-containing protein n=1 Tax=Dokdonia sinensis TaxID=2479847 RepID=A0A3M0FW49_9FLAO|nr:hypothetical protein [Dokdonia sinensis]RMB56735.1 hypothetical protein EAX61_13085 [Dokdonia sinensis]